MTTTEDAAVDRESRNRAGMRLLAAIVQAGGSLPTAEVTKLTTEAGYSTPGSWGGFLTGATPLLMRSGDNVIVTAAGWDWLGSVLLGVADLEVARMNELGVAWP